MEVNGTIKLINQEQQVSISFKKRELVVTTAEQYPQHILIQFVQDKCNLLAMFKMGDKVKIDINLRGREWVNPQGETKYFNSIQGWRISKLEEAMPTQSEMPTPTTPTPASLNDEPDDLPF